MNRQDHIGQAEVLVRETEQSPDLPVEERMVLALTALVHATLAQAKVSNLPEVF